MLVSIIVPIYNVERYLRECLDSLRNQTLKDIEIICVNDGSTDHSLTILREYAAQDSRFKILTNSNAGYGHTMNCGFAAANAPYACIVESDDFCAPDMCEKMYYLAKNNNLDIVYSNINLYWSKPIKRTKKEFYTNKNECNIVFNPRKQKRCFLLPPALCCMLIRMALIKDNNLRFLETPGASFQDTSFSFKLWASAQRAMMITDAFIYYRQDNEGSSINQPDKLYFVPNEYHHLENFLLENKDSYEELIPLMMKRKFSAYIWNYKRVDSSYHLEFAEYSAREFSEIYEQNEQKFLDQELFSSEEWDDLMLLIKNPACFVERMDNWDEGAIKRFHLCARIKRKLWKIKPVSRFCISK